MKHYECLDIISRLPGDATIGRTEGRADLIWEGYEGGIALRDNMIIANVRLSVKSTETDLSYINLVKAEVVDRYGVPYSLGLESGRISIDEDLADIIPSAYILLPNYPNPFNPNTTIEFGLPSPSHVSLEIYNVLGQKVITLIDRNLPAGYHSTQWNSTDDNGNPVATGIYLYKLTAGEFTETKKMILIK